MPNNGNKLYEFGSFQVDASQGLLLHEGQPVRLPPKTFELLLFLLERNNQVVDKETLMLGVWQDTFVEDANLTVHISTLRKIFNNDKARSAQIETFPKHGYRLSVKIAKKSEGNGTEDNKRVGNIEAVGSLNASADGEKTAGNHPKRPRTVLVTAIIVFALFAVILSVVRYSNYSGTSGTPAITLIAVLPFENRSTDESNQYLSIGLSEDLFRHLSKFPGARVTPIESAFKYSAGNSDNAKIAQALGVDLVLTGSFERVDSDFAITARLYDKRNDAIVWEKKYLRQIEDFQQVEENIIREVLSKIGAGNDSSEDLIHLSSSTRNSEAYDYFLRARSLRLKGGNENLRQSLEYFRKAYTVDPDFAMAYVETADVYNLLANNGGVDPLIVRPMATAAINRAFALDDKLPEAFIVSAELKTCDWKWEQAEADYQRAIELDPNSVRAHDNFSRFLGLRGKYDLAMDEIKKAQLLDPLSIRLKKKEGIILIYSRRYHEALDAFKVFNGLEDDGSSHFEFGWIHALLGSNDKAIVEFEAVLKQTKDDANIYCYLGYALAKRGDQEAARKLIRDFDSSGRYVSPATLAFIFIGLDEKKRALDLLDTAYEKRDLQMIYLNSEGIYDSLRKEPRFRDLLNKVGLPESKPL